MENVKFWKDMWCFEVVLCTSYLAFYAITDSKKNWKVDVYHSIEGGLGPLVFLGPLMNGSWIWWSNFSSACNGGRYAGKKIKRSNLDSLLV